MEQKVAGFLKAHNIHMDKPVIVACSGGADSVCLLYVLYKLGYKVVLAHVNHHKRLQSEEEEAYMKKWAEELGIPFELLSYQYSGEDNFHNDSHNARYDFFRSLCNKYDTEFIATAHHRDDQMETVLMKIMEGSNLYGYGGISVCNDNGVYKIVRPLLCTDKEEIYSYVRKENLKWFEDSSNQEDDFLRNRLRHHVVPLLKKECPDLDNKIMEYSIQVHEAFDFIRSLSKEYLQKTGNTVQIPEFNQLNIAVRKDILSLLLERYDIRKNNDIIMTLLDICSETNGTKQVSLEGNYLFIRNYDRTYITMENNIFTEEKEISETGVTEFGNYRFYFTKSHNNICAKYMKLCYNDIVFPLYVRYREKGDSITLGVGTKRVSRILIDKKVPKNERDLVPVITDSKDEILWVYDYAKSDRVVHMKETGDIYLVCEVLKHEHE